MDASQNTTSYKIHPANNEMNVHIQYDDPYIIQRSNNDPTSSSPMPPNEQKQDTSHLLATQVIPPTNHTKPMPIHNDSMTTPTSTTSTHTSSSNNSNDKSNKRKTSKSNSINPLLLT